MAISLVSQAHAADISGRFVEARDLYWRAFEAGERFDHATTLNALFVFFDSTDPGVSAGHGLPPSEVDAAREHFRLMLNHLENLGHPDDAEVWRWWIGRLGMDASHLLATEALVGMAQRGSREAAWILATDGNRTPEVVTFAANLRTELETEKTFRSAYVLHMLKDFQPA